MRLKKEHDGYHSSGLWLKYQRPNVVERDGVRKKSLDKRRWCGKKGVEHEWHRFRRGKWSFDDQDYTGPEYEYIQWQKTSQKGLKSREMPLHLWVKQKSGYTAVQVSVDGVYQPIKQLVYKKDTSWCYECQRYH